MIRGVGRVVARRSICAIWIYALVNGEPHVRSGMGVGVVEADGCRSVNMSSAVCLRYVAAVTVGYLKVVGNHSMVGESRVLFVEGM